ncbi:hypothetical protein MMC12_007506, partial [Toensbergia leucococca]|nr:hypothetical protein [Toensbergia leucococca]
MAALPIDTSLTGYASGSLDGQNDIYRSRQRPQPHPLVHDSGYGSAIKNYSSSIQTIPSRSLISLANSIQCQELLNNDSNFAPYTAVECYESDGRLTKRRYLDENGFNKCVSSSAPAIDGERKHRIFYFFATLDFAESATYRARSSFSRVAVEALISRWQLNDLFMPDFLGRPNYWCPELYSSSGSEGALGIVDFFCQYPRFAIHSPGFKQRSPVSIYMRYDAAKDLTYYIISAPESEECVQSFKKLLDLVSNEGTGNPLNYSLFQHPLEAHVLLSRISCDSSKGYINIFRQSMFAQLRIVDELSAQETADRKRLAAVTIELQIISKDVNKLISDVDVASRNLAKIQEALTRLDQTCSATPIILSPHHQQLVDTLQYLHSSMDKQNMWLHNYRDRKDIAMSLVFNLVTQQDAANNIEIAKDMRKDSSSMNGIALLTMVFLPGTFTS